MTLLTVIWVGSRLYSVLLEDLGNSARGGVAWRRLWVLGAERTRASTALRPPYSTRNGLCTPSGTSSCHKTCSVSYGYPQLTEQAKRKILGKNLLRLQGMDVEETRQRLATAS